MKVLFVCSGGMSSSILVNTLKKEAKNDGLILDVLAVGATDFASEIRNGWDVAMVAPQVRHRYDSFKESADEAGVPCGVIPSQAYCPLGGPALLKLLHELTKK